LNGAVTAAVTTVFVGFE